MTYTGIIVCIKIINYNVVALFEEMSRKLKPWNYKQGRIEDFPLKVGGGGGVLTIIEEGAPTSNVGIFRQKYMSK